MRWAWRIALLVALWLLAWGDLSLANVVSGVLAAGALLVVFPPERQHHRTRVDPLGAVVLLVQVAVQLVTSNIDMTIRTLRPDPGLRPGVLAHRLADPSDQVVTAMTSIIALSPGMMVVDVSDDASTIYVQFLRLDDVEAARAGLRRLEHLAERALPRTPADPAPEEQP
jgi:multicomponent Na+:H+ antiporter subunit E